VTIRTHSTREAAALPENGGRQAECVELERSLLRQREFDLHQTVNERPLMPSRPASTIERTLLQDDCLRRVCDLACWWSEVGASCDCPSLQLRDRLLQLRPHLARYLATQASPANPLLLADLDQLVVRLGLCKPSQVCWINLSHTIGIFLSQLRKLDRASRAIDRSLNA
jgi:hypothetical protein